MATNYYDDEDDFQQEAEVREQNNPLRKVNKELEKRLKQLEAENNSLKAATRQNTVKEVLASKGVRASIAKYIPQDVSSESEIAAWLQENAEDFNITFNNGDTETKQTPQQNQATPDLSANQRINNVVNTGETPSIDEDMLAKILNAKDVDSLNAVLGIQAI